MRNNLTERQKEILRLACFTNREIAKRLFLAITTVAKHFNDMRGILGATSKSSLLIEGIRKGEINIDEVETE